MLRAEKQADAGAEVARELRGELRRLLLQQVARHLEQVAHAPAGGAEGVQPLAQLEQQQVVARLALRIVSSKTVSAY